MAESPFSRSRLHWSSQQAVSIHTACCISHRSQLREKGPFCLWNRSTVFDVFSLFSGILLCPAYISFDLFCRIKHYAYIASVIQTDCYMKYFKIYKKKDGNWHSKLRWTTVAFIGGSILVEIFGIVLLLITYCM